MALIQRSEVVDTSDMESNFSAISNTTTDRTKEIYLEKLLEKADVETNVLRNQLDEVIAQNNTLKEKLRINGDQIKMMKEDNANLKIHHANKVHADQNDAL